jgi:hypothetical protein
MIFLEFNWLDSNENSGVLMCVIIMPINSRQGLGDGAVAERLVVRLTLL